MEDFDFEWFDQKRTPSSPVPILGIQKRGAATLNRAAIDALGEPEALVVGFDRAKRVIAIKGASGQTKGAYPVRTVGGASTVIFSLLSFAAKYDIPHDESTRYIGESRDGLLLFPLNQQEEEVGQE